MYPQARQFRREGERHDDGDHQRPGTPHSLGDSLRALRAKWGWIVALGIIFMIAGVIALGSVVMATVSAVWIVGIMMIMAGVAEIIAAFSVKAWGKAIFWGLLGVLYVAAGIIAIKNPLPRRPSSPCSWASP